MPSDNNVQISVPEVSGEDAASAIDLVDDLIKRYSINRVDADALFNGMVAIYIRQRLAQGDRPPARCSFAECGGDDNC